MSGHSVSEEWQDGKEGPVRADTLGTTTEPKESLLRRLIVRRELVTFVLLILAFIVSSRLSPRAIAFYDSESSLSR